AGALPPPRHLTRGGTPGKVEGTAELSDDGCYEKMPMSGQQTVLFIDLGTNGEMAITDGRRMIVTATAAGPAFEGDGTVIGTDRIALTARLLQRGILDETGLLEEPYFTEGVGVENGKGDGCYFKQEDIRSLQMAKAAIRAGVEILWEEMGRPEIGKVCLAGGFGYYLDVEAAAVIGLLPAYMRGRVQAVGNTSLAGAYELGRDLSADRMDDAGLEEGTALAESINLAELERFEGLYLKYMNLGES
ncbi:MAG: ATP-binding protein, partial [Lachnospiraceae bacterium]|nr:ATP-binding protein [Lachnospiraceae bacterium]